LVLCFLQRSMQHMNVTLAYRTKEVPAKVGANEALSVSTVFVLRGRPLLGLCIAGQIVGRQIAEGNGQHAVGVFKAVAADGP